MKIPNNSSAELSDRLEDDNRLMNIRIQMIQGDIIKNNETINALSSVAEWIETADPPVA